MYINSQFQNLSLKYTKRKPLCFFLGGVITSGFFFLSLQPEGDQDAKGGFFGYKRSRFVRRTSKVRFGPLLGEDIKPSMYGIFTYIYHRNQPNASINLGGGFKDFLFSTQKLGKISEIWRAYFSDGLVQPPTRIAMIFLDWLLIVDIVDCNLPKKIRGFS